MVKWTRRMIGKYFGRRLYTTGLSALLGATVSIVVAAIVAVYMWAYALKDVVTCSTLIGSTVGYNLLSGLFVVIFFLGIALIPLAMLYKVIKSRTR